METPNERELAFHKCDVCGIAKQMQCLSQLKDETYVACDNECDISAIQEMRHILDFLKMRYTSHCPECNLYCIQQLSLCSSGGCKTRRLQTRCMWHSTNAMYTACRHRCDIHRNEKMRHTSHVLMNSI